MNQLSAAHHAPRRRSAFMRPAPTSPRFGYYLGVVFGGFPPALSFFGWLLPVLSDEELGLDGEDIESEEGGVELEVDGDESEEDAGAEL